MKYARAARGAVVAVIAALATPAVSSAQVQPAPVDPAPPPPALVPPPPPPAPGDQEEGRGRRRGKRARAARNEWVDAPKADKPRRPLLAMGIAGAGTIAASWIGSIVLVIASSRCSGGLSISINHSSDLECHSASGFMLFPVVGPFLAMADNLGQPTPYPWENPVYVAGSVLNTVALAALIVGVAYKAPVETVGPVSELRLAPFAGRSATGLALSGTF